MDRPSDLSRRNFVRLGAAAAALSPWLPNAGPAHAAAPQAADSDPWKGLKVGVASYSLNRLKLDDALKALQRVNARYVSIKDAHLPLKSTPEERKEVAKRFRDAGITPLSCGNITMNDEESDIRNAFEYARDAGIPTIVCKPTPRSLPTLDKLVKEYDIRIAIHNHGPEDKVWPSPFVAWEAVQPFDERVGLCIDVGHTARCGVDPIDAIRKCAKRLHDVHFKDIVGTTPTSRPTEVGRGVLDTRGMLRALMEIKFARHVGLEYEKDLRDPIPGIAESLGYMKGVLSDMSRSSET